MTRESQGNPYWQHDMMMKIWFGYFLYLHDFSLPSLQVNQQIIFGPDNRSTGSITTWAVERIHRELGLTCNTGLYRITAEIVKDSGPVG